MVGCVSRPGDHVRLTPVQRRVLERADRDGHIVLGGIDATPGVRPDVVYRLLNMGLLRWQPMPSFFSDGYVLTDEGREILNGNSTR